MNSRKISGEENDKIISELLEKRLTRNTNETHDKSLTFGEKLADKISSIAGSWPFIIGFISLLTIWITLNVTKIFIHFDSYPFILLNLVLSCVAALQAPVIMMSQNRHAEKDRIKSEQDFETNEKAEIIIEEILKNTEKIEEIQKKQDEILKYLKKEEL